VDAPALRPPGRGEPGLEGVQGVRPPGTERDARRGPRGARPHRRATGGGVPGFERGVGGLHRSAPGPCRRVGSTHAAGLPRRLRVRPADRLRQRREPATGPRHRAATGAGRPRRPGRRTDPVDPAPAGRDPPALRARRHRGSAARAVGCRGVPGARPRWHPAAGGGGGRCARPRLRRAPVDPDLYRRGAGARAERHRPRRGRGIEAGH